MRIFGVLSEVHGIGVLHREYMFTEWVLWSPEKLNGNFLRSIPRFLHRELFFCRSCILSPAFAVAPSLNWTVNRNQVSICKYGAGISFQCCRVFLFSPAVFLSRTQGVLASPCITCQNGSGSSEQKAEYSNALPRYSTPWGKRCGLMRYYAAANSLQQGSLAETLSSTRLGTSAFRRSH